MRRHLSDSYSRTVIRSYVFPIVAVLSILALGTLGYYLLTEGRYSLGECFYMTAITVSTVGYHETIPVSADPVLRSYTIALILLGTGAILYLLSNVTAFLVGGELNQYLRRRRMDKAIEKMHDHYVICGIGRNGRNAVLQMAAGGYPVVLVDSSEDGIREFLENNDMVLPYVAGDARDEHVLVKAGTRKARGLIASLPEDADNIYLILSARELNPDLRIVAKISDESSRKKFLQVGADIVVSPTMIGGIRMYNEMVRPGVISFLDDLLHETGANLVMDEVIIPESSPLGGKRLAESGIRQRTNILVVGVRSSDGHTFDYNPGPDFLLREGMTLIVLGPRGSIQELRSMTGGAA